MALLGFFSQEPGHTFPEPFRTLAAQQGKGLRAALFIFQIRFQLPVIPVVQILQGLCQTEG